MRCRQPLRSTQRSSTKNTIALPAIASPPSATVGARGRSITNGSNTIQDGVGDRDLHGHGQHLRPLQSQRVYRRQCQCRRRRSQQDRVQRGVARAEHRGHPDTEARRGGTDQDHPRERPWRLRAEFRVADRNMGANDKHHQREADVREQLKRRVGVVDEPESGPADDESRDQLTDDHRNPQAGQCPQQRTGQTDGGEQRQCVKAESPHVS